MRTAKQLLSLLGLLSLLFGLTNCGETSEDIALSKAQDCLNKNSGAAAESCSTFLNGMTSEESYVIRCSIDFVIEGFDQPTKFSAAFDAMKANTGGATSPMASMLGKLSFSSKARAQSANSNCSKSGSSGMITFAAFVLMATTISDAAKNLNIISEVGADMTDAQMDQALKDMGNSSNEDLGAAAVAAESAYCAKGTSTENKEACDDLQAAVAAGTTNAEIGQQLRCSLSGNDPTVCNP